MLYGAVLLNHLNPSAVGISKRIYDLCFGQVFEFLYASIWVYTHVELECCPPKGTSFPRSGHAKTGTSHRGQSRHEVVYAAESVQDAVMS